MLDISGRKRGLLYRLGDRTFVDLLRISSFYSSSSPPRGLLLLTDEASIYPNAALLYLRQFTEYTKTARWWSIKWQSPSCFH